MRLRSDRIQFAVTTTVAVAGWLVVMSLYPDVFHSAMPSMALFMGSLLAMTVSGGCFGVAWAAFRWDNLRRAVTLSVGTLGVLVVAVPFLLPPTPMPMYKLNPLAINNLTLGVVVVVSGISLRLTSRSVETASRDRLLASHDAVRLSGLFAFVLVVGVFVPLFLYPSTSVFTFDGQSVVTRVFVAFVLGPGIPLLLLPIGWRHFAWFGSSRGVITTSILFGTVVSIGWMFLADGWDVGFRLSGLSPVVPLVLAGIAVIVRYPGWIGRPAPADDTTDPAPSDRGRKPVADAGGGGDNPDIGPDFSSDPGPATEDPDPELATAAAGPENPSESAEPSEQVADGPSASPHGDGSQEPAPSPPDSVPRAPDLSIDYDALTDREPIGRGGNADVYRATVGTPDGDVTLAVKEPRMGGTLHVEAVERMLSEAETWDKLDDHDHVVEMVDYGAEPLPWIAMEHMDGGDLGERAGEVETAQALWTAVAVAEAVRHAHRRGVAHLDIKPANVLFRSVDGAWDAPKVADWGLSKHLLEHSQSVEGLSPQYAAPEQFDDARGPVDDLTDVYQLGAIFYELFTGRPPFEGDPTQVMRAVLDEDPPAPSAVADVPDELDEILLTALATDRADRYESVLYLRDALRDLYENRR